MNNELFWKIRSRGFDDIDNFIRANYDRLTDTDKKILALTDFKKPGEEKDERRNSEYSE